MEWGMAGRRGGWQTREILRCGQGVVLGGGRIRVRGGRGGLARYRVRAHPIDLCHVSRISPRERSAPTTPAPAPLAGRSAGQNGGAFSESPPLLRRGLCHREKPTTAEPFVQHLEPFALFVCTGRERGDGRGWWRMGWWCVYMLYMRQLRHHSFIHSSIQPIHVPHMLWMVALLHRLRALHVHILSHPYHTISCVPVFLPV
jgi:hypothetical protein